MAVAFDAVGPSSSGSTSAQGASSWSWTHTAGTGGGTVLVFVSIGVSSTGSMGTVTATYGGNSMTLLKQQSSNNRGGGGLCLFGITGQASGANTVTITITGSSSILSVNTGASLSFTGAGSFGTPVVNFGGYPTGDTNSYSSGSVSVTAASGNMVAGGFADGSGGQSITAGTSRWVANGDGNSAAGNSCGATAAGTGSSVTISASWSADFWAGIGVEVQAATTSHNGTLTASATAAASFGGHGSGVSLVGSVGVGTRTTSGTTLTGAYGQTPTAGNLLVAAIAHGGTTAAAWSTAQHTGTTGWTHYASDVGNNTAGTSNAGVAVWYKTAAGGDAAPVFDVTVAGTEAGIVLIYELANADTSNPFDTNGVFQSGGTTSTIGSQTATTSGNVSLAGSYAIAVTCIERGTAASRTYANGGGSWVNNYSGDTATSTVAHLAADSLANPPSGTPLTATFGWQSRNSSTEAAAVVVVKPAPQTSSGGVTSSATASASFGGTKTALRALTASATASASFSVVPYIAGLGGSGFTAYFQDQNSKPRLLLFEMAWGLPGNAGRWNSGNWQSDMDSYFAARSSQGYTGWWGTPWISHAIDPTTSFTDGRTWDGVYPLTVNGTAGTISTGSETLGLNSSFWTRIDYLVNSALKNGITVFMNLGMSYDFGTGFIWQNLSTTQATSFGNLIATRYASYPNIQWVFGDDVNTSSQDPYFNAMLTGIGNAGDTRNAVTEEQYNETNCHIVFNTGAQYDTGASPFGVNHAQWNFCYTYAPPYIAIEDSYTETGYTAIPPAWGDGVWYGDTDNGTNDYTERRFVWWALASGARGIDVTSGPTGGGGGSSGNNWQWPSNAVAQLTSDSNGSFCTSTIGTIAAYFQSLPNWHQLVADTSSALVTSGRGTRASALPPTGGSTNNYGDTDDYVAASRTADGSLAVIYCAQHFSITIDQTKMASGYTATWVDPASCATTSATTGSSYSSTGKGNNSAGNPDWVLVLKGPVTDHGTLTAGITAHAAFGGTRTQFRSLTAGITAQASFRAVHPGHLTTTATAHAAFGGTRTQFRSLTAAATAQASFKAVHPGHLTAAATASAVFTRTRTTFAGLTPGITAQASFRAVHPGHLTTSATAAASFTRTRSVFGVLAPSVTAQASFLATHPGHLTTTVTAGAVLAGTVQGSNTGALTSAVTAQAAFSAVHPGHLTTTTTAQATFTRTRVQFAGLTSGITAHAAFSGVHPGHLTAGITAGTVFAGTKTALPSLNPAATAAASFTRTRTAFRGFVPGITAQAAFSAVHPGHLISTATAQAAFTGTKSAAGSAALTASVTAQAAFKAVHPGHLTTSATAQASFSTTRVRSGALTPLVKAQDSFAGTPGQFRSFSSAVTTGMQVSGTGIQGAGFTASAAAHAVLAGTKTGLGVLSTVITGQAAFAVKRTLNGSLVSSVTAQMGAFGVLPRLVPPNLDGTVEIIAFKGKPVLENLRAIVLNMDKTGGYVVRTVHGGSAVIQYNKGTVKFPQDLRAVVTRPAVFGGTVSPVKE